MAVTQIWPIRTTPGLTLRYISRPEKTDHGTLLVTNQCSENWKAADLQMQAHRQQCGKDSGILMHHGFVSFKKDEITIETAREFAREYMQGRFAGYQYFASVHQDTEHIHFNFAINAVALDGHKYNGCKQSLQELRQWTDDLCLRYGLSVIPPRSPGEISKERSENRKWEKQPSWMTVVKSDIDEVIRTSASWDDFLQEMKKRGYYIKHGENVKHILFKKEGMERGCR